MSETLAGLEIQLQETRDAISQLLAKGEEWAQGGRRRSGPSLADLHAREAHLERRINRIKAGGARFSQLIPDA